MCLFNVISPTSPIPLTQVKTNVKVLDVIAEVSLELIFQNIESSPIEAILKFPLDVNSAIYSFLININGKILEGKIKDKEQARDIYDNSIASGHGSYLLEQETEEIFTLNVGNLPPRQQVTITINYIQELEIEDNEIKFIFPMKALNGPVPLSNFPFNQPFVNFMVQMNLEMASAIEKIYCSDYSLSSLAYQSGKGFFQVSSQLKNYEKDLVVMIKTQNPWIPHAWVEVDGNSRAAMLAFYPKFENQQVNSEIIFVVDRSGSMTGTPIEQAKNCLILFLKSLPETCIFNIVGFGSSFYKLFPMSAPYNDDTLARAMDHVSKISADLNGTDLLPPLQSILSITASERFPRQLIILTDGGISNTEETINYVRNHSNTTRVFTFGIGSGVSIELVKGLADAGRGKAEFVKENERLQTKVVKHLKKALTPGLSYASLNWGTLSVDQAPKVLPPIFEGKLLLVYGFLKSSSPTTVTLSAKSSLGPVSFSIPINPMQAANGKLIHRLTTKALLKEDDPLLKSTLIQLAKTYSLASKYTSFVVVEKRNQSVQGSMQVREISVQFSKVSSFQTSSATKLFTGSPLGFGSSYGSSSVPQTFSFGYSQPNLHPSASINKNASQPNTWGYSHSNVSDGLFDFSSQSLNINSNTNSNLKQKETDQMNSILILQKADGSWNLDQRLAQALNLPFQVISNLSVIGIPLSFQNVWATLLCLAYLELKLKTLESEWSIIVEKSKKWLNQQYPNYPTLLLQASTMISSYSK